ncbi:MAG TPA: thioredoxin family protein [Longimicrobiales bacterium]
MTVKRERFREGYTWAEWLEVLGADAQRWCERYDATALGELRADYQAVPTPRSVLCIVDRAGLDTTETVPRIVRACEQAGAGGGVDVRILPAERGGDVLGQYVVEGARAVPLCVVFDDAWLQVGVWGPRPRAAQEFLDGLRADLPPEELDYRLRDWYLDDEGRSTLREFLTTLRGQGVHPWRAGKRVSEGVWKQAETAKGRGRGRVGRRSDGTA